MATALIAVSVGIAVVLTVWIATRAEAAPASGSRARQACHACAATLCGGVNCACACHPVPVAAK